MHAQVLILRIDRGENWKHLRSCLELLTAELLRSGGDGEQPCTSCLSQAGIMKTCVGVGEERNASNFESSDGFLFSLAISRGSLCPSTTLNPSLTGCERSTPEMGKPSDLEQKMAAGSV